MDILLIAHELFVTPPHRNASLRKLSFSFSLLPGTLCIFTTSHPISRDQKVSHIFLPAETSKYRKNIKQAAVGRISLSHTEHYKGNGIVRRGLRLLSQAPEIGLLLFSPICLSSLFSSLTTHYRDRRLFSSLFFFPVRRRNAFQKEGEGREVRAGEYILSSLTPPAPAASCVQLSFLLKQSRLKEGRQKQERAGRAFFIFSVACRQLPETRPAATEGSRPAVPHHHHHCPSALGLRELVCLLFVSLLFPAQIKEGEKPFFLFKSHLAAFHHIFLMP